MWRRATLGCISHSLFPCSIAFRATTVSQLWRLEPLLVFPFGVQSRSLPLFGIQSHLSSFGVQSHYLFPAWHSEPPCLLVYDVQSRLSQRDIPSYQFSWACRAFVLDWHSSMFLSFRRSEPCFHLFMAFRAIAYLCFGVQSHYSPSIRCSKPLHIVRFGVQSHVLLRLAFRAITHLRSTFRVTTYHSVSAFKATIVS